VISHMIPRTLFWRPASWTN